MHNPGLVIYPDTTLIVPPLYCGNVRTYAAMSMFGNVSVDTSMRFNKRAKDCHRCLIEGSNGVQRLTVPLDKPQQWHSLKLDDVSVSGHGEWWHIHWGALESAYGRTPYFEYYADELRPAYSGLVKSLVELDEHIHQFCLKALGMTSSASASLAVREIPEVDDIPYYQVWDRRFGFTPGLSILDLIFNMGPEAQLVLKQMTARYR